jgi:nucleoside-diphosphate-sugar epimerase
MTRVVVTGGSGLAGRAVVRELLDHGYEVVNVDRTPPDEPLGEWLAADLTDAGQAFEVLHGASSVVHLAAVLGWGTDGFTFRTNVATTFNVFNSAVSLGLERVVWASSETVYGLPFDRRWLRYAPVDEQHPLSPQNGYALSKIVGEVLAEQMSRKSGRPFIGLRFSNIFGLDDYANLESCWDDPSVRSWNLWGYVDSRDAAQACRLSLEADLTGSEQFVIAASDTVMKRSSRELMSAMFPEVELAASLEGFETLLSIGRAREQLNYSPQYSWRELS